MVYLEADYNLGWAYYQSLVRILYLNILYVTFMYDNFCSLVAKNNRMTPLIQGGDS